MGWLITIIQLTFYDTHEDVCAGFKCFYGQKMYISNQQRGLVNNQNFITSLVVIKKAHRMRPIRTKSIDPTEPFLTIICFFRVAGIHFCPLNCSPRIIQEQLGQKSPYNLKLFRNFVNRQQCALLKPLTGQNIVTVLGSRSTSAITSRSIDLITELRYGVIQPDHLSLSDFHTCRRGVTSLFMIRFSIFYPENRSMLSFSKDRATLVSGVKQKTLSVNSIDRKK